MCPFGEVVFAYPKQKQGFKADPKWKVGICLGKTEVQDAWVIGDGNRVFLSKSIRRVADASTKYIACYQGFTAYSWEYQQNFGGRIVPSKRVATMVGGPLLGLPSPGARGEALHDEDAREVIAFSKSYARKLEEAKDLVEVTEKKEGQAQEMSQEQKVAEDKKLDYVEEKVIVSPTRIRDPNMVDKTHNQAGPSVPATTPRSPAQKSGFSMAGDEGDAKRLKLTIFKLAHESEGESSETKRQKVGEEKPHVERRVQATEVGDEVYCHMDQFFGEEEFLSWDGEEEEEEAPSTMIYPPRSLQFAVQLLPEHRLEDAQTLCTFFPENSVLAL